MRSARKLPTRTDSLSLREQIIVGCIEAMETVKDELDYVPEIAPSFDEDGRVRPDICDRVYTSQLRQRLSVILARFRRVFPFPSLGAGPDRGRVVAKHQPSFEEWSCSFQEAAELIPNNLTFPGYDEIAHLEIRARALSLRGAFLRLSIELEAIRLTLLDEKLDAWIASSDAKAPRTSHHLRLLRARSRA